MTYAVFLLLFLVLPLSVLVIFLRRRLLDQRYLVLTGILTLIALVFMTSWDHVAAVWGMWTWTSSQTWGLRWWAIPPEEYLFCVLEALLAITVTYALFTRGARRGTPTRVSWKKHVGVHIEESDQGERS